MALIDLNHELNEHSPGNMILQSFSQTSRTLSITFTCDGGPKEDQALWLIFKAAVVFHLPSVYSQNVLNFSIASLQRAKQLIPEANFDASELGDQGFKVFELISQSGHPTGYYIVAESVEAKWVALTDCVMVG
ncbi:MAG: hypothetical protein AB7I41_23750 [Candidatus Sericytochromatia bacterium]